MPAVLEQVERQLIGAIRRDIAARRARRRRVAAVFAAAAALLVALSGASAISGEGPIADVLGVERDDPTLRSVREVPGAPRAVVRVRGDDGHLYTFAGFHARRVEGLGDRSICSAQTRDDQTRIPSLGCIPLPALAKSLRRDGVLGGPYWGGSHAGGLQITAIAAGFVPGEARSVTVRREGGLAAQAELSPPMRLGPRRSPRARAFLAVWSYAGDGATWLGPPIRRTITVRLRDGTTKRQTTLEPQFFPMGRIRRRDGGQIQMHHDGRPAPWRSVAYRGTGGAFCNAAAPAGERLARPTMLQCSDPLAIVNALTRYGAALYLSNFDPRRERGRRIVAAFGFTRADARTLTIEDARGRRYRARLSRPWETVIRRRGDLSGLAAPLRGRLEGLPRRMKIRSWIASLDVPPEPGDRGLRLVVRLDDGSVLRSGGR